MTGGAGRHPSGQRAVCGGWIGTVQGLRASWHVSRVHALPRGFHQFFNDNNPRSGVYGMERVETPGSPPSMRYGQGDRQPGQQAPWSQDLSEPVQSLSRAQSDGAWRRGESAVYAPIGKPVHEHPGHRWRDVRNRSMGFFRVAHARQMASAARLRAGFQRYTRCCASTSRSMTIFAPTRFPGWNSGPIGNVCLTSARCRWAATEPIL